MTGDDLLGEAVAELYSSDPDEFIERRGVLVARARDAGEASVAKQIAGLRKPTRSAWVINQLVRSEPGVTAELGRLGDELRAAQGSLDGTAIRELSQRRRQLIESLARQAFTVAGLRSPPAALRDEVTATLGAALADPQVAEQLAAGAVERVAHRDVFGTTGRPALSLVPPPSGGRRAPASAKEPVSAKTRKAVARAAAPAGPAAKATAQSRAQAAAESRARAAAEAKAEREHRRQAALAEAEQAVAEAGQAAAAAATAEQEQEAAVRLMEEQLADARQRLVGARSRARRARARARQARLELDRLRK